MYNPAYYLSPSSTSMSKTVISTLQRRGGCALLAFFLSVFGAPAIAAQQNTGQSRRTSNSPAVKTRAEAIDSSNAAETKSRASKTLIDKSIPDDPAVDQMLLPYSAKVRALDTVIGKLEGDLKKGGLGAGSLGNFVTDGMRAQASAQLGRHIDLAVTNSGGLRKNAIAPGDLRVSDIYELLPFENKLVELEMTGEQVMRVFQILVSSHDAQSGAIIRYREGTDKKLEFAGASLIGADGKKTEIDPAATYHVITIDYLLNVSGGNLAVFREAKSKKPLGITIRDAIIDYVKAETAAGRPIKSKLDGRFSSEPGANKMEERR
jgi:2',3'-cyclic-nucleotide 2'-phosphodiesterase (5'-nucleotidase family)